jgi:hypothetical protein
VLNTRPRDYYDVYILVKTRRRAIHKKIFKDALNATVQNRMSLAVLQEKDEILETIQSDAIMKQRWARYSKDNYYAKGIEFDEVIKILADILK